MEKEVVKVNDISYDETAVTTYYNPGLQSTGFGLATVRSNFGSMLLRLMWDSIMKEANGDFQPHLN